MSDETYEASYCARCGYRDDRCLCGVEGYDSLVAGLTRETVPVLAQMLAEVARRASPDYIEAHRMYVNEYEYEIGMAAERIGKALRLSKVAEKSQR